MKIGVIGGGAWGTALAQVAAANGAPVTLWAREPDVVESINKRHVNDLFLANVPLSETIVATDDLDGLRDVDALLVVAPAQHVRAVLGGQDFGAKPLVLCAKGIEAGSKLLVGEVARAVQPAAPIAVLSGPTFAHEVAAGLPTASSEIGAMREVLGDAGVYFDPERPGEIAAAIERLARSPDLRARNAQLAFERAHAYSWARCARETFAVFDQVRLASAAAM